MNRKSVSSPSPSATFDTNDNVVKPRQQEISTGTAYSISQCEDGAEINDFDMEYISGSDVKEDDTFQSERESGDEDVDGASMMDDNNEQELLTNDENSTTEIVDIDEENSGDSRTSSDEDDRVSSEEESNAMIEHDDDIEIEIISSSDDDGQDSRSTENNQSFDDDGEQIEEDVVSNDSSGQYEKESSFDAEDESNGEDDGSHDRSGYDSQEEGLPADDYDSQEEEYQRLDDYDSSSVNSLSECNADASKIKTSNTKGVSIEFPNNETFSQHAKSEKDSDATSKSALKKDDTKEENVSSPEDENVVAVETLDNEPQKEEDVLSHKDENNTSLETSGSKQVKSFVIPTIPEISQHDDNPNTEVITSRCESSHGIKGADTIQEDISFTKKPSFEEDFIIEADDTSPTGNERKEINLFLNASVENTENQNVTSTIFYEAAKEVIAKTDVKDLKDADEVFGTKDSPNNDNVSSTLNPTEGNKTFTKSSSSKDILFTLDSSKVIHILADAPEKVRGMANNNNNLNESKQASNKPDGMVEIRNGSANALTLPTQYTTEGNNKFFDVDEQTSNKNNGMMI